MTALKCPSDPFFQDIDAIVVVRNGDEKLCWVQEHGKGKSLKPIITRLVWCSCLYFIWQERNDRVHGVTPRQVADIVMEVKSVIKMRLFNYYDFLHTCCYMGIIVGLCFFLLSVIS